MWHRQPRLFYWAGNILSSRTRAVVILHHRTLLVGAICCAIASAITNAIFIACGRISIAA